MLLKEYKDTVEFISNCKITNTYLSEILGTTPQNISKRIKNNSVLTTLELSKLEDTFGIYCEDSSAKKMYKRYKNLSEEFNTLGNRLNKIQMINGLSNKEMANILNITEEQLWDIIYNDAKLSIDIILKLSENFNVDLNWLFLANSNDSLATSVAQRKVQESKKKEPILKPEFNLGVQYEFEKWGKRLLMLQVQSGMLESSDFAKFLDIPEKDLDDYIMKSKYPKGEHLLKMKIRFSKTDFNWLLFGEN